MTSPRKAEANRANACASTGPRTAAGKARSARNASRHGLRSPVLADPALSAEVQELAREIAGARASWDELALAARIAEAQVDLVRVRRARHDLLVRALAAPQGASPRFSRRTFNVLVRLVERFGANAPLSRWGEEFIDPPEGPKKLARILEKEAGRLAVLERYERRARSRHKFAIRDFDAARRRPA